MNLTRIVGTYLSTVVIMIGLVSNAVYGQKSGRETFEPANLGPPTGVMVMGNPTCADLNASTDPEFAHIDSDWGLKINRGGTNSTFNGTFAFQNGGGSELQGGASPSPGHFVTISMTGTTVDWSSNRLITAVIVKGGPMGAKVYPYNPPSTGGFPNGPGTGLTTGGRWFISHLVFCFGTELTPSAAPASVSGRVIDSNGNGIAGASLVLSDVQTGTTWMALTNPFGNYTIDGPEVGNFYMITVNHRRFSFDDGIRTFTLNDNISGMDFVASP